VSLVGARGQDWGRLVLLRDHPPLPLDITLVERAASALALNRLLTREHETLERQSHRSLLAALLANTEPSGDVLARARALGVRLDGRRLLGLVVRPPVGAAHGGLERQARLRDLSEALALATRAARVDALIGALDDRGVGLLAALSPRQREVDVLAGLAAEVRRSVRGRIPGMDVARLVMAAGSVVAGPREAGRSLAEAGQVADAAAHLPAGSDEPGFLRLPDLRLRGLLQLLGDDPRVHTFVERELGALAAHDAATGEDLLATLRAYLTHGRNKSLAASAVHVSRQAVYERLTKISRILDADLEDVETCLSLHVALLARDAR
jgi:purine catabolism regulator